MIAEKLKRRLTSTRIMLRMIPIIFFLVSLMRYVSPANAHPSIPLFLSALDNQARVWRLHR